MQASNRHRWRFTVLSLFLLTLNSVSFAQEDKDPVESIITASDATPVAITTNFPETENESSASLDVEKPSSLPEDVLPADPAPFSPFPSVETTTMPPKN